MNIGQNMMTVGECCTEEDDWAMESQVDINALRSKE